MPLYVGLARTTARRETPHPSIVPPHQQGLSVLDGVPGLRSVMEELAYLQRKCAPPECYDELRTRLRDSFLSGALTKPLPPHARRSLVAELMPGHEAYAHEHGFYAAETELIIRAYASALEAVDRAQQG